MDYYENVHIIKMIHTCVAKILGLTIDRLHYRRNILYYFAESISRILMYPDFVKFPKIAKFGICLVDLFCKLGKKLTFFLYHPLFGSAGRKTVLLILQTHSFHCTFIVISMKNM